MASSTLDPDNIPEPDRRLRKGHGTGALGPSDTSDSDTSDSGSDVQGNTDSDSDTDAAGTGERAAAGRDSEIDTGADIDVDRVDSSIRAKTKKRATAIRTVGF